MSEEADFTRGGERVAVVGGGLAGMAAALVLAENGCRVDLFEQRRRLGGRVGSFRDPKTGELVDRCMHVAMGCCTNFIDLVRRAAVEDCFERHTRLTFLGPGGEVCPFTSRPWLPPPLHLLAGFARLHYLSRPDRLSIGRCLVRLGRLSPDDCCGKTTGPWLRAQGQSEQAIERFWSVVLVSALGETLDRTDLGMARKVFLDGFLRSAHGYELLLPTRPLGEILDGRVGSRLRQLGVGVHLAAKVEAVDIEAGQAKALALAGGSRFSFDWLVVALPWTAISRVLSPGQLRHLDPDWQKQGLQPSAITAVHLWFDRQITSLPHAAIVGRTSQWIFQSPRPESTTAHSDCGHRYQVVISASGQLADLPAARLLDKVLGDLRSLLQAARAANLLHHRIITERNAVFSVTPEAARSRPGAQTSVANLFLAGDWTRSGWPATMEGAVLSGYQAASVLLERLGRRVPLPVSGLKPSWLARMLFPRC